MKRWIALLAKMPMLPPQSLPAFLTAAGRDPLTPALIIATALHAALIISLGFSIDIASQHTEELAVTIALNPSAPAANAEHIAAINQAGMEKAGAKSSSRLLPTTTMTLGETNIPLSDASDMSMLNGSDQVPFARPNYQSISDSSDNDPSVLGAVAARQSLDAGYLAKWRSQIEEIGMMLSEEHRALGEGDVRLAVRVLASGELAEIRVIKTSGDLALDRAAQNTVVLAAPFPAFSAELARQTSELTIVRTWQFRTERRDERPSW